MAVLPVNSGTGETFPVLQQFRFPDNAKVLAAPD